MMNTYGDLSYNTPKFFIKDADAIYEKLELLFSSLKGDWFFDRNYDCDMREYLFQPLQQHIADEITLQIYRCINKHIPEITLLGTSGVILNYEKRQYEIKIDFEIKDLGVFSFSHNINIIQ